MTDWNAIADAMLKVWTGGGWQLCLFVVVVVMFWRKPWFRDGGKP